MHFKKISHNIINLGENKSCYNIDKNMSEINNSPNVENIAHYCHGIGNELQIQKDFALYRDLFSRIKNYSLVNFTTNYKLEKGDSHHRVKLKTFAKQKRERNKPKKIVRILA